MEDYSKYKKEDLVEIMDYLDKEITSLDGVAIRLCELLSCENCPVTLLNQDFRTEEERILRHATCCSQLYNWIKKEATKN